MLITRYNANSHVSAPTLAWLRSNALVVVRWLNEVRVARQSGVLGVRGGWRIGGILGLVLASFFAGLRWWSASLLSGGVALGCALLWRLASRVADICPAVEELVANVTGVPTEVSDSVPRVPLPGPLPTGGAVRHWLDLAILKFGRMQDTPADRRVLRLWLAEEMKKADMRNADIVRHIPTVVEFMFIPGVEELMAKLVRDSATKRMLVDLAGNRMT